VGIVSKFQIAIYVFALVIINAVSPVGAAGQKQSLINYEKDGDYIAQFELYLRTYKIEVTKTGSNLVAYVHFRRYRKCDEISLRNDNSFKSYCFQYLLQGTLQEASLSGDFGSEEISFIPINMYEKYLENKGSDSSLSTKDYTESLMKNSDFVSQPESKLTAPSSSSIKKEPNLGAINYSEDGTYFANDLVSADRTMLLEIEKTGGSIKIYGTRQMTSGSRQFNCENTNLNNDNEFVSYCTDWYYRTSLHGSLKEAIFDNRLGSGEPITFIPKAHYDKYLVEQKSNSDLTTREYAERVEATFEKRQLAQKTKTLKPTTRELDVDSSATHILAVQNYTPSNAPDGDYLGVYVSEQGVEWKVQIEKTGDNLNVSVEYKNCMACGRYSEKFAYCNDASLGSGGNFESGCTITSRARRTHFVVGNLKNAQLKSDFYQSAALDAASGTPHFEFVYGDLLNSFLQKSSTNSQLQTSTFMEARRNEAAATATAKVEHDRKAKSEQKANAEKTNREAEIVAEAERVRLNKKAKIAAEAERKIKSVSDGKALENIIGREGRKQIQFALKAEGYLTGSADGVFGNSSREAIRQFQSKNGSFVSGYLSASDTEALKNIAENSKEFIAAEKKRKEKALADAKKTNETKAAAAAEKKRKKEIARKATEKKKDQQARKAKLAAEEQKRKDDGKRKIAAMKAEEKAENEKLFLQNDGIAKTHIEGTSKFVKINPTHSSLIDLVSSITSLRAALKVGSGKTLLTSISQHEELIKSVKGFSEFAKMQDAAKRQEVLSAITQLENKLVDLGTFLSTFVADNISDEIEVVSKVVPLLKSLKRDRSDFKPDQYRKKISEIELVVRENEPLHRSFQKFKSEIKAKHDVAEKKRIEEVQDREDAQKKIASQEEEKKFQARFAKLKSKISKKQAEKNEKDQKVARRKMVARLLEKQKLIKFSGKVVFAVSSAEDEIKISRDEDDSGKLTGFDVLAGCRYTFLVKNLTKYDIKVFGFSVGQEGLGKTVPVQMNMQIPAGENYKGVNKHEQIRFASWTRFDQKEEPSAKQQKEMLDKLGCNAQKGTIFLEYGSAKNFMKFPRKARFKDRSITKFIAADESAAVPIRFHEK
jgi:peptidoglycan hydrolase-like protein with peptidoglycan-binding domain